MWEMFPYITKSGVAHPFDVEGGAHGNCSFVRGEGRDVAHPLCSNNNVMHDMEHVLVFPPLRLLVSTFVDKGAGESRRVSCTCPAQHIALDGGNVISPHLAAYKGGICAGHVATG